MPPTTRLFALIQSLRTAIRPVTAEALAREMEVSTRTVYRDIAVLQALRVPVEGAAGVGYILRRGYDLPPLNFDVDEIEALRVGLAMLARSGDGALLGAARRVAAKIAPLQDPADWLQVAPWGAPQDDPRLGCVPIARLRQAVREEEKLRLIYQDAEATESRRIVRPIVLIYHVNCTMLAAWCELRAGFRHFRCDRMFSCEATGLHFTGQGALLRDLWAEGENVALAPP